MEYENTTELANREEACKRVKQIAKAFETFDEEFGGGMVVVDDEDSDEDENK